MPELLHVEGILIMIKTVQRYVVDQAPAPTIGVNFGTWYHEIAIDNSFREDIVMLDGSFRKIRIPGKKNNFGNLLTTDGCVTIYIREHLGWRQDYEKKNLTMQSVEIPVKRIVLRRYELDNAPIYVNELNTVFGMMKDFDSIAHPHAVPDLFTVVDRLMEHFDSHDDESTIHFIANDPEGRTNKLFLQMCSRVVEIPVYHFKHNFPSLTILMRGRHGTQYREEILLEDLYNETKELLPVKMGCNIITHVSLDRDALEAEVFKLLNGEERFDNAYTKELVDRVKEQCVADLKAASARHDAEMRAMKDTHTLAMQEKANELKSRDLRISELEAQMLGWKNLHDAKMKEVLRDAEIRAEEFKIRDAELKMKKSELEYHGVMWKILGGAAIAVGTYLLADKLKK
jgi:hypothetical protein